MSARPATGIQPGWIFSGLLFALGTAAACGPAEPVSAGDAPAVSNAAVQSAVATISAADMRERIGIISHDSMGGRATPSPGLDRTAAYIAREFEAMGLEAADGEGFIQLYQPFDGAGQAPNVAAVWRGADPALSDSYVVFSAHMDHVGIGVPDAAGDSIYNGADDDASGTAAVLEIAQAFAGLSPRPARSVAFVAVSGEESGLFGSEAFIARGAIPVSDMIADLNIDMIGRNSPDTVVVIGLRYSDLGQRLGRIVSRNGDLGLVAADDPWPDEGFFFRSDHFNFAQAGVPALFFFAGVHEDYHRPSDEVDRIDSDKAARIARLAFLLGLDLANDPDAPEWTREGRAAVRPQGN